MTTAIINVSEPEISFFCHKWNIQELALFGSVLRDDFGSESDVDVLVTFQSESEVSLFDMAQMQIELQAIFHRSVDILEKDALRNPYRKQAILSTAQVLYAA